MLDVYEILIIDLGPQEFHIKINRLSTKLTSLGFMTFLHCGTTPLETTSETAIPLIELQNAGKKAAPLTPLLSTSKK